MRTFTFEAKIRTEIYATGEVDIDAETYEETVKKLEQQIETDGPSIFTESFPQPTNSQVEWWDTAEDFIVGDWRCQDKDGVDFDHD